MLITVQFEVLNQASKKRQFFEGFVLLHDVQVCLSCFLVGISMTRLPRLQNLDSLFHLDYFYATDLDVFEWRTQFVI